MELATILGLLQAIPGILSAAQTIRADLSETDQAKLDAAIATARATALADIAKAESDLAAAAKAP